MPIPPVTQPAARPDVRTLKLRVKRSFARAQKRGVRTRASYTELPRKLWDRFVLLMFICCLFTFLHALLGFGAVDEDLHASNGTLIHPRATPLIFSSWNHGSGAPNGDQELHTREVTQMMVDWHGNLELLPIKTSALVSPASVPQDGFPDPTPAVAGVKSGRTLNDGSLSVTTKTKAPVDGTPYDPIRLEYGDSVHGGETRGPYAIAGPPRTALQGARTRRFGGCLPGDACL